MDCSKPPLSVLPCSTQSWSVAKPVLSLEKLSCSLFTIASISSPLSASLSLARGFTSDLAQLLKLREMRELRKFKLDLLSLYKMDLLMLE
jgi:hypothetical protein